MDYNPFNRIFPNGLRQDNVLVQAAPMLNPFGLARGLGHALNDVFGNPAPQQQAPSAPPQQLAYGPNNGRYAVNDPTAMYGAPAGERNMPSPVPLDFSPPLQDTGLDATAMPLGSNPFAAPQQMPQPAPQITQQSMPEPPPFSLTPVSAAAIQAQQQAMAQQSMPANIPAPMTIDGYSNQPSNGPLAGFGHQTDVQLASQAQSPVSGVNSEAYAQQLLNAPTFNTGQGTPGFPTVPGGFDPQTAEQLLQQQLGKDQQYAQQVAQQNINSYQPPPTTSGPAPQMMAQPALQGEVSPSSAQQFQLNPDSQKTYDLAQQYMQQQLQQAMGGGAQNGQVQQMMDASQGRMRRNNMMSSLAGAIGAFMPQGGMGRKGAGSFANGAIGSFQQGMQRRNNNETMMFNALSRQMGDGGADPAKMAAILNAVRGYDVSSPENQRKATYSDARQQDAGTNAQNADTKRMGQQSLDTFRQQTAQTNQQKANQSGDIGYMNAVSRMNQVGNTGEYLRSLARRHEAQNNLEQSRILGQQAHWADQMEQAAEALAQHGQIAQAQMTLQAARDMATEVGRRDENMMYAAKNGLSPEIQAQMGVPQPAPQQQQPGFNFFGLFPQPAPQQQAPTPTPQPSQSDLMRQKAMGMMGGGSAAPSRKPTKEEVMAWMKSRGR